MRGNNNGRDGISSISNFAACCKKITIHNATCPEEAASSFFDTIESKYGLAEKRKLMERRLVRKFIVLSSMDSTDTLCVPEGYIHWNWDGGGAYSFYY